MGRWLALGVLLLAALVPSRGRACTSCYCQHGLGLVDGASVRTSLALLQPTNLRVLVSLEGGLDASSVDLLRDGAHVPFVLEPAGSSLAYEHFLSPVDELEPEAGYEIVIGSERLAFRTVSGADHGAPTLRSLEAWTSSRVCDAPVYGRVTSSAFDAEGDPTVPLLHRIEIDGEDVPRYVFHMVARPDDGVTFGDMEPSSRLGGIGETCLGAGRIEGIRPGPHVVHVTAIDAAGNESETLSVAVMVVAGSSGACATFDEGCGLGGRPSSIGAVLVALGALGLVRRRARGR